MDAAGCFGTAVGFTGTFFGDYMTTGDLNHDGIDDVIKSGWFVDSSGGAQGVCQIF
jgi:hypothetical protein